MKGYWIAFVSVKNPDAYAEYLVRAPIALKKYGAKMLARGEELTPLEGFAETPQRAVIFEFESYEQAVACYQSPEYQDARSYREGHADAQVLIVRSLPA